MDLFKEIGLQATKLTKKVKDTTSNLSVDTKIHEQEKKIKELSAEIGTLMVKVMDAGETTWGDDVKERYDAILKVREEIKELEAQKVAEDDDDKVVCAACGKVVANGMSFCGNCGAKVEPKAKDDDDSDED